MIATLGGCGRLDFAAVADPIDGTPGDSANIDGKAPAAIAVVQAIGATTEGPDAPATFASPVQAGDVLIAAVDYVGFPSAIAFSDTLGTSYTQVVNACGPGNFCQYIGYGTAPVSGPDTLSGAFETSVQTEVRIHEFAGLATSDAFDVGNSSIGTAPPAIYDGPAVATTAPNELVFGFILDDGTATTGPGATTALLYAGDVTEYLVAPTPGTYCALEGQTLTGSTWYFAVAAFRGQ